VTSKNWLEFCGDPAHVTLWLALQLPRLCGFVLLCKQEIYGSFLVKMENVGCKYFVPENWTSLGRIWLEWQFTPAS